MQTVTVSIPPEKAPYTLFAEGQAIGIEGNAAEGYEVLMDASAALLLFYHFPFHRRLYVTAPASASFQAMRLSGVSRPRSVLCVLYGRAFDRMKRSLPLVARLTKNQCHLMPPAFWLRLSSLMQRGKNSRANIASLVSEFTPTIAERISGSECAG